MTTPEDLRYHHDHLWARRENGTVRAGITDYAQEQLGEVVYVGLPDTGTRVEQGQPFGEIESTKTVSDLHAPVTGVVVELNDDLDSEPGLVNADPYGRGWLIVIEPDDPNTIETLLTAAEYDNRTG